jgi:protocatechuate 3,4-dioxygenase beta subunit
MRDFDENNITDAVIERFGSTPDARLKTIMTSLVGHLHDFVRDVELTFDEWDYAIGYLTRTGQMCTDKRQEFILLSDTIGVSMLVDAINHRMPEGTTETTVLGPFYVAQPPVSPLGADISGGMKGDPLVVEGSVSSSDGQPLPNAVVDVWQADGDGYYDVQRPELSSALLRARFRTDGEGKFYFRSIMPSFYPIPDDGPVGEMLNATGRHPNRPAHIHFMIAAAGHETLITHVFDAESPYLDSDAVFGVKNSLIANFSRPGTANAAAGIVIPFRHLKYDFGLMPVGERAARR